VLIWAVANQVDWRTFSNGGGGAPYPFSPSAIAALMANLGRRSLIKPVPVETARLTFPTLAR